MEDYFYGMKPLPADHPIFTRGWSIGARRSTSSSNNTPASSSSNGKPKRASSSNPDQEIKDWLEKGMYEAAGHQMGSQSGKTDGSASSTSADKPDSKS